MHKQWEYKKVKHTELKDENYSSVDMRKLNALGSKGWQLVGVASGEYLFMREVLL